LSDEIQAEVLKFVLADFLGRRASSCKPPQLQVRVWGDQSALLYMISMGQEEASLLHLPIQSLTGRAWMMGTSIILYDRDVQIVMDKLPFL
jgi:hypothetical protein